MSYHMSIERYMYIFHNIFYNDDETFHDILEAVKG